MVPRPYLPLALAGRPLTLAEARAAGLTSRQLQGKSWRRMGHGLYVRAGRPVEPLARLAAAARTLPDVAAFAGRTTAWLHGLDVPPDEPVEAVVPRSHPLRARAGVVLHRARLTDAEAVVRRGLRLTTIVRTLSDLAMRADPVDAVVLIDTALAKRLLAAADLASVPRLGRLLPLVDGRSESPMESRLRVLLVMSGLPKPDSQVTLRGAGARVDFYYPAARLAIEYDGATHRDSLAADNRRQNRLLAAGYRLLRFSASDLLGNPQGVVAQVRTALLKG